MTKSVLSAFALTLAVSTAFGDAIVSYQRTQSFPATQKAFKLGSAGTLSSYNHNSAAFFGDGVLKLGFFGNNGGQLALGDTATPLSAGTLSGGVATVDAKVASSAIAFDITGVSTTCVQTDAEVTIDMSSSACQSGECYWFIDSTSEIDPSNISSTDCSAPTTSGDVFYNDTAVLYDAATELNEATVACIRITSGSSGEYPRTEQIVKAWSYATGSGWNDVACGASIVTPSK